MSVGATRPRLLAWSEASAFLGFGLQVAWPILMMGGILLSILGMSGEVVHGRIVPAAALMICLGTLYNTWLARGLAASSGRSDVATLPSGIGFRHMIVSTFVVMWPVVDKAHDPMAAWGAGLAWTFLQGVILIAGGFLAPLLRRVIPRAALLGAVAGTAIGALVLPAFVEIAAVPVIGMVCLAVVLLEGLGGLRLVRGVPAGVVAAVIGGVVGWGFILAKGPFAHISWPGLKSAVSIVHLHIPYPALDVLFQGFDRFGVVLATALPFGIYNLVDSLNAVESAETAGDSFPVTRVLVGSGVVTLIGSLLGCPIANSVFVGQPGWKALGGRAGYAAGVGVTLLLAGCLTVASLAEAVVPPVALWPIVVFVGLWSAARAFNEVPSRYVFAFLIAIAPWMVSWAKLQIDNALGATGTAVELLGLDKLAGEGVVYPGIQALANGPTLIGIVLGAIAVFTIDRRFLNAAGAALIGAVLTFFGVMHTESFFDAIHAEAAGIGRSLPMATAYLATAIVLSIAAWRAKPE